MINFCQFGAGRIGSIHAANIARHPRARLATIVDIDNAAAARLAELHGASVGSVADAFDDPQIDAVVIASSTDTHADLVETAAHAGKAIFCEKPLDLDCQRAAACAAVAAGCGVKLMVGFNRRFDPSFAQLERQIRDGRIGRLEMLTIISRDPAPPPIAYVAVSGGLFRDMMIHDFDMARFLCGEEAVEVTAAASNLVDPAIGAAGDVDTAAVTLRMASGALAQISNSRRAVYGYDQRVEAFGSKGALRADNVTESTLVFSGTDGVIGEKPLEFFPERYAEAYRRELAHFIDAIEGGTIPCPGSDDGVKALALADAALKANRTGRAVRL
jgi:myo-inositol 2-dehydrogenase / D-chiro-inositol 1-dehydrogenase